MQTHFLFDALRGFAPYEQIVKESAGAHAVIEMCIRDRAETAGFSRGAAGAGYAHAAHPAGTACHIQRCRGGF